MVRWSLQHCDSEGLRKWLLILGRKYQGTTPGNCKVVGSNLQSELIFRIHNYEFSHRSIINSGLLIPLANWKWLLKSCPRKAGLFTGAQWSPALSQWFPPPGVLPATQICWDRGLLSTRSKIGREQWQQSLQSALVSPFSLYSRSRFQVNVPTLRLAAASHFA